VTEERDILKSRDGLKPAASQPNRQAFGYRFEGDVPAPVHKAFKDFSAAMDSASTVHR